MSFKSIIKFISLSIVRVVVIILAATESHAVCNFRDHGGGVYVGDIGNVDRERVLISMMLHFDENVVTGLYSYLHSNSDVLFKGKISDDGKTITIEEVTKDGSPGERFVGAFAEEDPRHHYSGNSKLNCDVITGDWYDAFSKQKVPFYLDLEQYGGVGDIFHHYRTDHPQESTEDDEIINQAVIKLKDAIARDDREALSSLINFPVNVTVDSHVPISLKDQGEVFKERRTIEIESKEQLFKIYDKVFTRFFKEKILMAHGRYLFGKVSGIMLGRGIVWFDTDGKITRITNLRPF